MGAGVVVSTKLEVVLASCNGGRFLDAQVQTLWHQQRRPDRLLVFDDDSSDGSAAILERWQQRHPDWIQQLTPSPQRLGPSGAFQRLLQATSAPYVALCDQDDLWHPERLSTGLQLLQTAEQANARGSAQPLLIHCDAELVNAEGDALGERLWQRHRVSCTPPTLWQLALRNQVTGCTILCNRALLQQALPLPTAALMHDWWLALIACRHGGLLSCPEPLLQHRRHHANASGPQSLLEKTRSLKARWRQWRAVRRHHPHGLLER